MSKLSTKAKTIGLIALVALLAVPLGIVLAETPRDDDRVRPLEEGVYVHVKVMEEGMTLEALGKEGVKALIRTPEPLVATRVTPPDEMEWIEVTYDEPVEGRPVAAVQVEDRVPGIVPYTPTRDVTLDRVRPLDDGVYARVKVYETQTLEALGKEGAKALIRMPAQLNPQQTEAGGEIGIEGVIHIPWTYITPAESHLWGFWFSVPGDIVTIHLHWTTHLTDMGIGLYCWTTGRAYFVRYSGGSAVSSWMILAPGHFSAFIINLGPFSTWYTGSIDM